MDGVDNWGRMDGVDNWSSVDGVNDWDTIGDLIFENLAQLLSKFINLRLDDWSRVVNNMARLV
jgi:hypothetical protein